MTDRYRGPVEAGSYVPPYTPRQLALVFGSCAITAALVFLVAGLIATLTLVLGLALGGVYGAAR